MGELYSQQVTQGWRLLGVSAENNPLSVGDHDVWACAWANTGRTIVARTPGQRMGASGVSDFPRYVDVIHLEAGDESTAFAAIEFTPGFYAFYVPDA